MKPEFVIGVFAVILDEQGRVLLGHRTDYDLWNLPGGTLEHGETPWDGLRREVMEETGLEVEVLNLTGIYSKPDKNEVVLTFICKRTGGSFVDNEESDKIDYFDINILPENISQKHVERIRDAIGYSDQPALKIQTGRSTTKWVDK